MLGLLLAGCAWVSAPASAQIPTGFYVSAGIGANQPMDSDINVTGPARALAPGGGQFRYNALPMGVLALGYGFGNGVRVELEGSFRANQVTRARGAAFGPAPADLGLLLNSAVMGNALFELDVGSSWFQPYLGFGLGYAWTQMQDGRIIGNNLRMDVEGTDGNFAYQLIAGAAFPISGVPGLAATLEYRYFATLDPSLGSGRVFNTTANNYTPGRMEIDNAHHSLLVGLRYAFGAQPQFIPAAPLVAPPLSVPAAPVAAAPVTRTYIVYFGHDSARLTDRAREIVAEAARAALSGQPTRVEVVGHTDRRGRTAYNQALSQRRAQAVASELRRRGVPSGQVAVQAVGETLLAVETPDQVREPQNRRVEITLR